MATPSRRADPSVAQRLFEAAPQFDFFQAVRLLERLYPERQPVGREASPGDAVVRFHAHVSLGFPPSAVHAITPPRDASQPAHMTVAFMGLVGLMGALPRHYTELLLERARQKDATLRDFLDLFHHRLTALFYRAWEKYRFPVAHERAMARPQEEEEPFAGYLFHLIGLGTPGLRGRQAIDDHILLQYAGLLSRRVRSASTLAGLLQDYFRVPVAVTQFVGQWLPLEPEQRSCLGVRTAANTLGATAVAGRRVWDQQASVTVRLGPLTLAEFRQLLPTGSAFRPLLHLTRFVAGPAGDFTVRLVLHAAEVPRCRLGQRQTPGSQLGYTAWLPRTAPGRDADDAVFPGAPA